MTWNSNPKYGALGWVRMDTWGSRIFENVDQAIAHQILRYAIINLRAAGYPVVLHVYDEIVGEVPIGAGSVEHFESIMGTMPSGGCAFGLFARRAAGVGSATGRVDGSVNFGIVPPYGNIRTDSPRGAFAAQICAPPLMGFTLLIDTKPRLRPKI